MHFMLKSAMVSYLNHTPHQQHDYTTTKAMDIIYLLIIAQFFLDRYTITNALWSFWQENKMLW